MPKLIRIVDDDEGVRESLAAVLRLQGYEVKAWADPEAYLREDAPHVPGCLLLDVMMPGVDGYEVQRRLVERADFIPVIFISAYGDIAGVVRTMKLGACDFLQKPLSPERVIAAVASALKGQAVAPPQGMTRSEAMRRYETLTERERAILEMVYEGRTNAEVARRLAISHRTVENHRAMAYRKLMVRNGEEARSVLKAVWDMRRALAQG